MSILTLKLQAQTWFTPITRETATLALRSPQPFIYQGLLQIQADQTAYFRSGMAEFRALSSNDLLRLGLSDAYYVLTVNQESYTLWMPDESDPIFRGAPGETAGDLSRLIQMVPSEGGPSPPPAGAGISQSVLAALAQVQSLADSLQNQGAIDRFYHHRQPVASAAWVIHHNLGKFPSISIVDSAGNQVQGDTEYSNDAQCIVRFSAAFAGDAYCN